MTHFRKWEVFGIRVLFAWLVFQNLPIDVLGPIGDDWLGPKGWLAPTGRVAFDSTPIPHGIANWIDVSFMSDPRLQVPLWIISVIALISYIAGRGLIVSLPVLTLMMIFACSLKNSQGFVYHGHALVGLILLTQMVVFFVHTIGARMRKRSSPSGVSGSRFELHDYLIRYAQVAIVAGYIVAGVSKIVISEGEWVQNSHYIGVYIAKTYRQNYHQDLDAERYGQERVPYASTMLNHPNLARLLMTCGLALELFCFVGLWRRSWLALVGLAIIIFHRIVEEMMGLRFRYNEIAVWIFFVNPVFWLGVFGLAISRRFERTPTESQEK